MGYTVAITGSPVGPLTLVSNGAALVGVYFEDHRVGGPPAAAVPGTDAATQAAEAALAAYFGGQPHTPPPMAPEGGAFQQAVWALLRAIPAGATTTYGALAARLGKPKAARAVGVAVGRNPISILIPCHRVIGKDGSLTGYAGGLGRKQALLALEGHMRLPTR